VPGDLTIRVAVLPTRSTQTVVDGSLPTSHTCNQQLELPRYSTKEILKERLLYAIANCTTIEMDFMATDGYRGEGDEEA
jgi:hypothetical protein